MARRNEKPVKRVGTRTHRTRKEASAQAAWRDARAAERHGIAVFVRAYPGSIRQAMQALEQHILKNRLGWKPISHQQVKNFRDLPQEMVDQGPIAFYDKKRVGRPRKTFSPKAEEKVQAHLKTQKAPSIAAVARVAGEKHDEEVAAAATKGETVEGERPTYASVHGIYERQDLAEKSAARHGGRAAEFDALPRSEVVAEWAHDVHTADEFDAPVVVQFRARQTREIIALKPRIALSIDDATRVLPSVHVTNMTRKGYAGTCDSDDFRAMLLTGAIPELAERYAPPCHPYSGYLPREIRWDRAGIHNAAIPMMQAAGCIVPGMEGANPPARGMVERPVGILGDLMFEIRGYDPAWQVTEALREHPKAERTKSAATLERTLARINLDVDQLLTLDEFCEELWPVIRRYHRLPHETEQRATREELYFERFLEERCLPGRNIALGLEKHSCTVGKYLVHRRTNFPVVFGGTRLRAGGLATIRPDPLLRGALTDAFGGGFTFLHEASEAAKATLGADVTRSRRATARALSDGAAEVRSEIQRNELGDHGAAQAEAGVRTRFGPSAAEQKAKNTTGGGDAAKGERKSARRRPKQKQTPYAHRSESDAADAKAKPTGRVGHRARGRRSAPERPTSSHPPTPPRSRPAPPAPQPFDPIRAIRLVS